MNDYEIEYSYLLLIHGNMFAQVVEHLKYYNDDTFQAPQRHWDLTVDAVDLHNRYYGTNIKVVEWEYTTETASDVLEFVRGNKVLP